MWGDYFGAWIKIAYLAQLQFHFIRGISIVAKCGINGVSLWYYNRLVAYEVKLELSQVGNFDSCTKGPHMVELIPAFGCWVTPTFFLLKMWGHTVTCRPRPPPPSNFGSFLGLKIWKYFLYDPLVSFDPWSPLWLDQTRIRPERWEDCVT